MHRPQPSADDLLPHLRWLRELAGRLVQDAHAAEDAVQDTVVAALAGGGPRHPGAMRAWLRTTLRNALFQSRRADARRSAREQRIAREATAPAAADVAAELGAFRELLRCIDELEEPYRSTLTRRFVRGQSPRQIARLLEVPLKTVHTRIARGTERLRARLDQAYTDRGGRAAWVAVLLPTAWRPGLGAAVGGAAAATAGMGIAIMNTKTVASVLTLAVGALALWSWSEGWLGGRQPEPGPVPVAVDAVRADSPTPAGGAAPAETQRVVRAPATQDPVPADAPAVAGPSAAGVVVDLNGVPRVGVAVAFETFVDGAFVRDASVAEITSGAEGRFELAVPQQHGRLTTASPGQEAARRPWLRGRVPTELLTIVVGARREFAGRVVDQHGSPVANAHVAVALPASARSVAGRGLLDGSVFRLPRTLSEVDSGDDGRFDLGALAAVETAYIEVERDGYTPLTLPLPAASDHGLTLVLEIAGDLAGYHGVVLDARGATVADAVVAVGQNSVRTGVDGRFRVAPADPRLPAHSILAAKPGVGSTVVSLAEVSLDTETVLRLSDGVGAVRGVVVDAAGQPVPGAHVWTPDTTFMGHLQIERNGRSISGIGVLENVLAEVDGPAWSRSVVADDEGQFELVGLADRDYAVFALAPDTLAATGPVMLRPSGAEVTLRLPAGQLRRVAGRVLSQSGVPLAGVEVTVGRALQWDRPVRAADPWSGSPIRAPGAGRWVDDVRATTDAEGRFDAGALSVEGAYVKLLGDAVFLARNALLADQPDTAALELRVDARSTFRLAVSEPGGATAYRIVDGKGESIPLFVDIEDATMSMWSVPLDAGRSTVAYSREGEVTVVLMRDEEELRRVPLFLPAGGVHELAF